MPEDKQEDLIKHMARQISQIAADPLSHPTPNIDPLPDRVEHYLRYTLDKLRLYVRNGTVVHLNKDQAWREAADDAMISIRGIYDPDAEYAVEARKEREAAGGSADECEGESEYNEMKQAMDDGDYQEVVRLWNEFDKDSGEPSPVTVTEGATLWL